MANWSTVGQWPSSLSLLHFSPIDTVHSRARFTARDWRPAGEVLHLTRVRGGIADYCEIRE